MGGHHAASPPCAGGRSSAAGLDLDPARRRRDCLVPLEQADPVISVLVSFEQGRCGVLVVDDDVDVAIVVEVAERRASADVIGVEIGAGVSGRQQEPLPFPVAVQQGRLVIGAVLAKESEIVVDVAVGDEAIGPAVVVEIRQAQPQPTQGMLSVASPMEGVDPRKCRLPVHGRACCTRSRSW